MHRVDPARGPWVALVGIVGAADVVLHDRLGCAGPLGLTRADAVLIDVGKGKGCGPSQRYIEALIVAHHADGSRVVRLKGGDPFVFGRGVEEVRAARAAGATVEVVPGISSALAGPALAGIAVTERHVSGHVTVVSGHRVEGDNDWTTLAGVGGTLVVLMAATTGPRIAAALVAGGLAPATPVACVTDVSGAGQHVTAMDLGDLAARDEPLPGPCVLVIGAVAADARTAADAVVASRAS